MNQPVQLVNVEISHCLSEGFGAGAAGIATDPRRVRPAVEELIRYRPSVIAWRRKTRVAVEIAGTRIPAGANLLLYLASGNRDEAVFDRPEALDIGRGNARAHLSFGFGAHF